LIQLALGIDERDRVDMREPADLVGEHPMDVLRPHDPR
jgi:hypothetical protein